MLKKIKFLSVVMMLVMAFGASAQVTTSSINGTVTDESKEALVGATILARHTPSGTTYGATTNSNGRYNLQGMRTGGPYTIEISYIGYTKVVYEDVYLQLGDPSVFNAKMQQTSSSLGEVVVLGSGNTQAGAAKSFNLAKIEAAPSINHNVYDIVKNTPFVNVNKAGGISIAGINNRYNSFQIDGTVSNDVFGLAPSGTNGGQSGANPISMEAIQELQVVISPFDVRQSGFTGGGINAVTKQGTNDFHAAAYTYYNNEGFYGRHNQQLGGKYDPLTTQRDWTIGGNVAGAAIKDKLFYFVNVEHKENVYPASWYPGYKDDSYITKDVAQQILDKYNSLTGGKYHDSFGQRDVARKSLDILARIDWNINDKHRLALRYQHMDAFDEKYSPSQSTYYFNGSSYKMNNLTNSFVAELNSRFNNEWSNEFRVSYNRVRDHRDIENDGPCVYIKNVVCGPKKVTVDLGTEYSSGVNFLNQDIYTIEDNVTWYKGNHAFTFGTHNEIFKIQNGFIQYANGQWTYDGLDNFLNDNYNQFQFKCSDPSKTGGDLKYAPVTKAGQFGLYAQDKWDINRNFQLSYGIRFDMPVFFNSPTENKDFNEYSKQQGWGVEVGTTPSAKLMVSPRIGFRWYTDDSHKNLFRGGLGLFTGRIPFVWASNAYNNSGMEQIGMTLNGKANVDGAGAGVVGGKLPSVPDLAKQCTASKNPDIVTLDRKLKFPQVFRANLAWESQLGMGWKLTLEGLYSKTFNNMYFENLAIKETGKVYAVPGVAASAAPFYSVDKRFYTVINTKNADDGYSYQLSALLQKSFAFGLDLAASYTFGHSFSVYDGTSLVAYSNWKYNYAVNTNKPEMSYSMFDIPNRVMVSANYTSKKYANGMLQTVIGLVYNGSNGMRYSLTQNESADYNGDGYKGNSLMYIPTVEELALMNFASDADRTAFGEMLNSNKYTKFHRGEYAKRNSCQAKWENQVDLHFAENIFYLRGRGSKIALTIDILNFANLLNHKWGASYGSSYNRSYLSVSKVVNNNGVATPTFKNNVWTADPANISSRWHMQIGCKVTF